MHITISREAFVNMMLREADHYFDNYKLVSRQVLGSEWMPKEVK